MLFQPFVSVKRQFEPPQQPFPAPRQYRARVPELFREYLYDPLFRGIAWTATQFLRLQHGNIHLYVLYIAVTLLALLVWKLGAVR